MPPKPSSEIPQDNVSNDRAERIRAIVQDLRVVFRVTQAHSKWVEKQCGVSAAQLWAMSELAANPGAKVSELSRALSIHQSTASNMLDKLEVKGLVKRERAGKDQRVVCLFLTDEGTELLARAPQPAQGAITHALEQLPAGQLDELERGLDALVDAMSGVDLEAAMQPLSEK